MCVLTMLERVILFREIFQNLSPKGTTLYFLATKRY